jgi:hypothetical protein
VQASRTRRGGTARRRLRPVRAEAAPRELLEESAISAAKLEDFGHLRRGTVLEAVFNDAEEHREDLHRLRTPSHALDEDRSGAA